MSSDVPPTGEKEEEDDDDDDEKCLSPQPRVDNQHTLFSTADVLPSKEVIRDRAANAVTSLRKSDSRSWCLSGTGLALLGLLAFQLSKSEVHQARMHVLVDEARAAAREQPCWPSDPVFDSLVHVAGCDVVVPYAAAVHFGGFEELLPHGGILAPWVTMHVQHKIRARNVMWREVTHHGLSKTKRVSSLVRAGSYMLSHDVAAALPGSLVPLQMARWQVDGNDPPCKSGFNSSSMKLYGNTLYDKSMDYRVFFEAANASTLSILARAIPETDSGYGKVTLSLWEGAWNKNFSMVRKGEVSLDDMLTPYLEGVDTLGWVARLLLAVGFIPAMWCTLWPFAVLGLCRGRCDDLGTGTRLVFRTGHHPDHTLLGAEQTRCPATFQRAVLLGAVASGLVAACSWLGVGAGKLGWVRLGLVVSAVVGMLLGLELLMPGFVRPPEVEAGDLVREVCEGEEAEPLGRLEDEFMDEQQEELVTATECKFAACLCVSIMLPAFVTIFAAVAASDAAAATDRGIVT